MGDVEQSFSYRAVCACRAADCRVVGGARRRMGCLACPLGLLCAALPWLLWANPRPLLGVSSVLTVPPEAQYFSNAPNLQAPYENAVTYLQARDCHKVGLWWGGNDFEYPLSCLFHAPFLYGWNRSMSSIHRSMFNSRRHSSRARF